MFQTSGRIRGVKMMMAVLPLTDTGNKNQQQDKIFAEISQLELRDNQCGELEELNFNARCEAIRTLRIQ